MLERSENTTKSNLTVFNPISFILISNKEKTSHWKEVKNINNDYETEFKNK